MSAHQYPEIYEDLGIDLKALGCIMLDLEPIDIKLKRKWLYESPDEAKFWIKGDVSGHPHVSLLYGLLEKGAIWKDHVDRLLSGITLDGVFIEDIIAFESPYPDEKYACIVGKVFAGPETAIYEAHSLLSYLPHINTFPGFNAHVTLAYVHEEYRDEAIANLQHLIDTFVVATNINYGGNK